MAELSPIFLSGDAAAWTGGRLVGAGDIPVYTAEVDSRRCSGGCLFFALAGERVDGHDYINAAFGSGACGAVVSSEWFSDNNGFLPPDGAFVLDVEDPLAALQKTAAEYMKGISGPVRIGVTGSNGKTTTKELIASVLSEKYSVVKTSGNYNSEIGLPLTVFNIKEHHEYAVIEMGINRVGEMDVLSEILRPDLVVITNIGTAHIGIFKTIETIAYEKRRAAAFFSGGNVLFVDENEPFSGFLGEGLEGSMVAFGRAYVEKKAGRFAVRNRALSGWEILFKSCGINFPLIGEHNLKNAFCAISVGLFTGLSLTEIKAGLEKAEPLFGRSQIIEGDVTIIQDCYNSNVNSLLESIRFADGLEWDGMKRYVIGDMKELGADSAGMHRKAGAAAAASAAVQVLFFGPDSRGAYEEAVSAETVSGKNVPKLFHTADYDQLEAEITGSVAIGDLVLLKGSRSMNLERLVQPLKNKFRSAEC